MPGSDAVVRLLAGGGVLLAAGAAAYAIRRRTGRSSLRGDAPALELWRRYEDGGLRVWEAERLVRP